MKLDPNELAVEIDRLAKQVIGPGNLFLVGQSEALKFGIAAGEAESPDVDGPLRIVRLSEPGAIILRSLLPVAGTYVPEVRLRAALNLDESVASWQIRSMVFGLAAKLTDLRSPALEIDCNRILGYRIILVPRSDDLD